MKSEPFDVFVRRVCPDYAHVILGRVQKLEEALRHRQPNQICPTGDTSCGCLAAQEPKP